MATEVEATATVGPGSGLVPYRLTVRQYLKIIDAGVFPYDARVELLGGVLAAKMTKYAPHNFAIFALGENLRSLVPAGWLVREEKSVVLGRFWRPEPDIAVVRGPDDRYRTNDPARPDLDLLIEVADSSYVPDRGVKWRAYAAAGVPVYWIVNLPLRQVEIYTIPGGRGKSAAYRDCVTFGAGDEAPVVVGGKEVGRVGVKDILP